MKLKTKILSLTSTLALTIGTAAFAQSASVDANNGADASSIAPSASAEAAVDAEMGATSETADSAADVDTETNADVAETEMNTESDISATANDDTAPAMGENIVENAEEPIGAESDAIERFAGMTVGDVVGKTVIGGEGEVVGEIDYVLSEGDSYSAVIGIGGVLGIGEHTVKLPLEDFEMSTDGTLRVQAMNAEELEQMPEIDESEIEALESDHVIS